MPWCSHAFEPGTLDPEEDELEEELEELEDIFALRVKNSLKKRFPVKPLVLILCSLGWLELTPN